MFLAFYLFGWMLTRRIFKHGMAFGSIGWMMGVRDKEHRPGLCVEWIVKARRTCRTILY